MYLFTVVIIELQYLNSYRSTNLSVLSVMSQVSPVTIVTDGSLDVFQRSSIQFLFLTVSQINLCKTKKLIVKDSDHTRNA